MRAAVRDWEPFWQYKPDKSLLGQGEGPVLGYDRGGFSKAGAWLRSQGRLTAFQSEVFAWFLTLDLQAGISVFFHDLEKVGEWQGRERFLEQSQNSLRQHNGQMILVDPHFSGMASHGDRILVFGSCQEARSEALARWGAAVPGRLDSEGEFLGG